MSTWTAVTLERVHVDYDEQKDFESQLESQASSHFSENVRVGHNKNGNPYLEIHDHQLEALKSFLNGILGDSERAVGIVTNNTSMESYAYVYEGSNATVVDEKEGMEGALGDDLAEGFGSRYDLDPVTAHE